MRLRSLEVENWMIFRGRHALALDAKSYAVVARREGDVERSNYGGKSALVEAVPFALLGWTSPERDFLDADSWITNGEKEGGVRMTFDDGSSCSRERKRGKATQVRYRPAGSDKDATQVEAEKAIVAATGLSREDFFATSFWRQGQVAAFVNEDPAPRTRVVASWLRMHRLVDAAAFNSSELLAAGRQHALLLGELDSLRARREALLGAVGGELQAGATRDQLANEVAVATERFESTSKARLERKEAEQDDRARAEYDAVVAEGKRLRAEFDALPEVSEDRVEAAKVGRFEASARAGTAKAEFESKRMLAKGEFDGTCPLAGIRCPARAEINEGEEEHRAAAVLAGRTLDVRKEEARAAVEYHEGVRAVFESRARTGEALARLREKREALLPARDRARNRLPVLGGEDVLADASRLSEARRALREHEDAVAALARLDAIIAEKRAEAGVVERRLVALREAGAILGRSGAQRRVAEGVLARIARGANEELDAAGVGFGVSLSWQRDGGGIAKACEACGAAFPKSERVKECEQCGSARGANVIHEMTVRTSARSGATGDLAGLAIGLAANRWLREDRGSAWSCAVFDEPSAQLDAANRRAFSLRLPRMLERAGLEQAFVVAHHAGVLDALPGRVLVTVGPDGYSRAEVAS